MTERLFTRHVETKYEGCKFMRYWVFNKGKLLEYDFFN